MEKTRQVIIKAVEREEDAIRFYRQLKTMARAPGTKVFIEEMIAEETRHKETLIDFLEKPELLSTFQPRVVESLGIADAVASAPVDPNLTYQDALIVAMKREEESIHFYEELQRGSQDEEVRHTLDLLIGEEQNHLGRLEREYDQWVLTED